MTDLLSLFLIAAFLENLALARFFDRVANPDSAHPVGLDLFAAAILVIGALLVLRPPPLPSAATAYLAALSLVACAISVSDSGVRARRAPPDRIDWRVRMALPVVVGNAAVLVFALLDQRRPHDWSGTLLFCAGATLAFQAVVTVYPSLAERLEASAVPRLLRGLPITLITAGILSLAAMAFPGAWP